MGYLIGLTFIIVLMVIACMLLWAIVVHNRSIDNLIAEYLAEMNRLRVVNNTKEQNHGTTSSHNSSHQERH